MIPLPVPYGEHPPDPPAAAAITQVFSETALRLFPQTTVKLQWGSQKDQQTSSE